MTGKFLHGLAVSVALGAAFCLFDVAPRGREKSAAPSGSARTNRPAKSAASGPAAAMPTRIPANPGHAPDIADPTTRSLPLEPPPTTPGTSLRPPQSLPEPPAKRPPYSPEPSPAPRVRMRPAESSGKTGKNRPMLPLRRMLMGAETRGAVSSGTALASLASESVDPACGHRDLPEKGIEVRVGADLFSERQRLRDAGRTFYDQDGAIYSVGIRRDWSIDSVVGLSLDFLDAELKSGHMLDYRRDDITGYRVNLHYESVLFDRLTFDARGFYGRLRHKGGGYLSIRDQGNAWRENWKEDRHSSETYGFAAKAGMPLLWGPDVKVLPEIGVNFTRLRTGSYTYFLDSIPNGARAPKKTSTSMEIPVGVTLRRDYLHSWGMTTPKLGLSYTLELDDSAAGVRARNSSAAARVIYDPATKSVGGFAFDDSQKAFARVDLGMEVKTVGGWRLNAEYSHVFAEKYNNDIFRLEIGRCF